MRKNGWILKNDYLNNMRRNMEVSFFFFGNLFGYLKKICILQRTNFKQFHKMFSYMKFFSYLCTGNVK